MPIDDEILEAMGSWAREEMRLGQPGSPARIRGAALLGLIAEFGDLKAEVVQLRASEGLLQADCKEVEERAERLRGLLAEAMYYLNSCGCDDEECPGRQKAAQLQAAMSGPAESDGADG